MPKTPLKSARRRASWTAWTSIRLAHPAHRRTKAEEADTCRATKTGQLNSLSTVRAAAPDDQPDAATIKVIEAPCISIAQLRALRAFLDFDPSTGISSSRSSTPINV